MSDMTPAAAGAQEIAFSKQALKALGEVPGLRCGALSPLVRIAPPDAPSDRAGLVAALTALTVDESKRQFYFISGNTVYQATLP